MTKRVKRKRLSNPQKQLVRRKAPTFNYAEGLLLQFERLELEVFQQRVALALVKKNEDQTKRFIV